MTRIFADSSCIHGAHWTTCRKCIETTYCGCCGYGPTGGTLFCRECDKHVINHGELHSRTYFAQHGQECPNQV